MALRAILIPLLYLVSWSWLGCGSGTPSSPAVPPEAQPAVDAIVCPMKQLISGEADTIPAITMEANESAMTATIAFDAYEDEGSGYVITGTLSLANLVSGNTATLTIVGPLSLSGGVISEVIMNGRLVIPWDSVAGGFAGEPTAIEGTVKVDGTTYQFASFGLCSGDGVADDPRFVAVGLSGTIVYSKDGSNWGYPDVVDSDATGTSEDLSGVGCAPGGRCLAVGGGGVILRSDNGTTWSVVRSGGPTLQGVVQGADRWVAVGDSGTVLTASDEGGNWSASTSGTSESLHGVAHGNGIWVAVGTNCTVIHSSDAVTWETVTPPFVGAPLEGVATDGGGNWVAVGGVLMLSSTDAANWSGDDRRINYSTAVAYGQGRFVAVGQGWGQPPTMVVSDDQGTTWQTASLPVQFSSLMRPLAGAATDGQGRWSVMGNGGDHLLSIDNGDTWQVAALDKYGVNSIAYRP